MKRLVHIFHPKVLLVLAALSLATCGKDDSGDNPEFREAFKVLSSWNHLLLELDRNTPGYRPPVSARMFAYTGMAAYEVSLPALPDHISMDRFCPDYEPVSNPGSNFVLAPALNAAYAAIARDFFPTAPATVLKKIDDLEAKNLERFLSLNNQYPVENAVEYGKAVAKAVWHYSTMDSVGHDGFMFNFDRSFKYEDQPGKWQPDQDRPMPPLLPYWGKSRPFVVDVNELEVKPPAQYSLATNSTYYSEAFEVYSVSQSLSSEDRWIAEFWSDDVPGLTITPSSRWISIANQAIEKAQPGFVAALEIYLKAGLALCDSGIACWTIKYKYQTERPQTYINRTINPGWAPLHKNPSFPGYPSGHSIFGSSVAVILSSYLGDNFELTDRTHEGRKEFSGQSRTFKSFEEMAKENAYSRILNGVHFRMDCEEGLRLGKQIGKKVLDLPLHKDKVAWVQSRVHH